MLYIDSSNLYDILIDNGFMIVEEDPLTDFGNTIHFAIKTMRYK